MITIVSATELEIAPLIAFLKEKYIEHKPWQFAQGQLEVHVLITGVGSYAMMYGLMKYLTHQQTDLLVNAGIAGAFATRLKIGDVVQVNADQIADLGAEDGNDQFDDIFQIQLADPNNPPFADKKLITPGESTHFLPTVSAISSNTVSGKQTNIDQKIKKYNADIETMEGAAFAYVCLMENQHFVQIRSISNYVEVRDKSKWNIGLAVVELNKVLIEMVSP